MPRLNYKRNKKFVYQKGDYEDHDNPAYSDDYPRFRNNWNNFRHGHHGQQRPKANVEHIRRVMFADMAGPSHGPNTANPSGETWMRANIANASSLTLDFFKESFSSAIGITIKIFNYTIKGDSCIFYFKCRSKKLNESIKAIKAIVNPNTQTPIVCEVKACLEPDVPFGNNISGSSAVLLPDSWMEALRQCFKDRFANSSRILDLSSLHTDTALLTQGLYIPLNKSVVFLSFLAILQENNAKLSSLNLSHNRLRNLQPFEDMKKIAGPPTYSFDRLDLTGNFITAPKSLEALTSVPGIIDLDLSDTPLSGRLSHPKSGKMFEAHIVKILPGLRTLNGKPVKTTVQFAIEQMSNRSEDKKFERMPLLPSIQGHFGNEELRTPVLTFLMEYFTNYDAEQRGDKIYNYYTSASTLTMALHPNGRFPTKSVVESIERVNDKGEKQRIQLMTNNITEAYFKNNRNLVRCRDEGKRMELVSQGGLNIAATLSKLPATEHILESLCVDVIVQNNNQIILNVSGVFYEILPFNSPNHTIRKVLRCFNRVMIVVAPGTKILQDNLVVSNPPEPLIERYIADVKRLAKTQEAAAPSVSSPQQPINVQHIDQQQQEAMVAELRRQTGMNASYSRQCLQEFAWQFEAALNGFRMMNESGKIPQAAFAPE